MSIPTVLTIAEIQGAYQLLTNRSELPGAVGAASRQIEGQLAFVGSLRSGSHDPKTASENHSNAENNNTDSERLVRKSER